MVIEELNQKEKILREIVILLSVNQYFGLKMYQEYGVLKRSNEEEEHQS